MCPSPPNLGAPSAREPGSVRQEERQKLSMCKRQLPSPPPPPLLLLLLLAPLALLVLAAPLARSVCPEAGQIEPCTCDDEGLQCLRLNDTGLGRVFRAPAQRKAIRRVWIFQTNLTRLPRDAFSDYIIRDLYLDLNQIVRVEAGAFGKAARTLQSLSLTRNLLADFPFEDLKSMVKLKQLGLGHNCLGGANLGAFPASSSLESIDLSHNQIARIEPHYFADLHEVTLIDLSRNNLTVIKARSLLVRSSSQDLVISLRANRIRRIAPQAFGSYHPRALDLSRNQLTYLDERLFAPLLANSTMINVDENPFTCRGCKQYRWLLTLDRESSNNLDNFLCPNQRLRLEDLSLESIGCTPGSGEADHESPENQDDDDDDDQDDKDDHHDHHDHHQHDD